MFNKSDYQSNPVYSHSRENINTLPLFYEAKLRTEVCHIKFHRPLLQLQEEISTKYVNG
jgi:hypothetical protein